MAPAVPKSLFAFAFVGVFAAALLLSSKYGKCTSGVGQLAGWSCARLSFVGAWHDPVCDTDDQAFHPHNVAALTQKKNLNYTEGPKFTGYGVAHLAFELGKMAVFFATAPQHPIPNEIEWLHGNHELTQFISVGTLQAANEAYQAMGPNRDQIMATAYAAWSTSPELDPTMVPYGSLGLTEWQALCAAFTFARRVSLHPQKIFGIEVPYYSVKVGILYVLFTVVQLLAELIGHMSKDKDFTSMEHACREWASTEVKHAPTSNLCPIDGNCAREYSFLCAWWVVSKDTWILPTVGLMFRVIYTVSKVNAIYRGSLPYKIGKLVLLACVLWLMVDLRNSVLMYYTAFALISFFCIDGLLRFASKCAIILPFFRAIITFAILAYVTVWVHSDTHSVPIDAVKREHLDASLTLDTYLCTFMKITLWDFHKVSGPIAFIAKLSRAWIGLILAPTTVIALIVCIIVFNKITSFLAIDSRHLDPVLSPVDLLTTWFKAPNYFNLGFPWCVCCPNRPLAAYFGGDWWRYSLGKMLPHQKCAFEKQMGYGISSASASSIAEPLVSAPVRVIA